MSCRSARSPGQSHGSAWQAGAIGSDRSSAAGGAEGDEWKTRKVLVFPEFGGRKCAAKPAFSRIEPYPRPQRIRPPR